MKKLLFPLLAAFACLACEKTIDIDVPVEDSKIVLHSFLNPDSTLKVQLTRSAFVLDETYNESLILEGASVRVFEDGKEIGSMQELQQGWYELAGFKPKEGKTYRLDAEKAGFDKITASERILPAVPIAEVSLDTTLISEHGYTYHKVHLSFVIEDQPGENFYVPAAFHYIKAKVINPYDNTEHIFEYLSPLHMESSEPFVEMICSGSCFSIINDSFIDGKRYQVRMEGSVSDYPSEWEVLEERFYVKLYNVSPSYYFYHASLNTNLGSGEDPFSEPTPVFTNVEGGYGLLGSLNASHHEF